MLRVKRQGLHKNGVRRWSNGSRWELWEALETESRWRLGAPGDWERLPSSGDYLSSLETTFLWRLGKHPDRTICAF